MKKIDSSHLYFSDLVTMMARQVKWDILDAEYKDAFNKYFLNDRCFQYLCDLIYHNSLVSGEIFSDRFLTV